ncbi:MAG: flagellar assembly protein FliW [Chloroflexi bacterium]|nr:flagellar assembly protein FliW [Chloroflexota bacterium]MDA1241227.1 flagellar assembly protein FliW [Chloroflexota bacterium]
MKVKTNFLGVEQMVEVGEEQIFAFEPGVGGFESLRRYALVTEADSAVEWLQSLDDADVCFALLDPFTLAPDYSFEMADVDVEALGMAEPTDVIVRGILTLHEDPRQITMNLVAPLVLCRRTHLARQVILQGVDYSMRYPVFTAIDAMDEAEEEHRLQASA